MMKSTLLPSCRLASAVMTLGWCHLVSAQPLDRPALAAELAQLLDGHPSAQRTTACLKVVDPQSGEVLFDRHGDRLLTPASNLKIFTAACALDRLGPDHRFATRLRGTGPLRNHRLCGDLVLIGGGDAMLSTNELSTIADRVVSEWQLRSLAGEVRVDNSRYRSPLKGPGWMWDDDPDPYNMSITPLMLDFNVLVLRMERRSDGMATASLVPRASYPPLVKLPGLASAARVERRPFTHPICYQLPAELTTPLEHRLTPHDPGRWIAAAFRQMLTDRGVQFEPAAQPSDRGADAADASEKMPELVHEGPPVAVAVRRLNKVSENAVGEILLHEIAIREGYERPGWPDGAKAITNYLIHVVGLPEDSFRLVDGSGLSRYNLIAADASTRLLCYLTTHAQFPVFLDSLPFYDVDTRGMVWPDAPDALREVKRIAAKPGGMTGVATISGYVMTLDGRRLAFSLLTNGFVGDNQTIVDLRGKVWCILIRYRPPADDAA